MNTVNLVGQIYSTIEMKHTEKGTRWVAFQLKYPKTEEFYDIYPMIAFDKTADFIYKNIRQGDLVTVSGRLNNFFNKIGCKIKCDT